ncbi:MAG: hypothetical protein PHV37_05885 [Candidatus Gastranaerophilales bacterium]|nr:hypothetical protein [Candidatus Gastranaerophilales bacterium]
MATIIENPKGRRIVKVSTDDVINIVREYQSITYAKKSYYEIRAALNAQELYIPEDI